MSWGDQGKAPNSLGFNCPDLEPWRSGAAGNMRVAAYRTSVRTLGPGMRAVVWVQGCPFSCPGCVSPGWASFDGGWSCTPGELLSRLLGAENIHGLTISGGEPMLQAVGLAQLVRLARRERELDVICYSGFELEQIDSLVERLPGSQDLLAEVDVLIDGPYLKGQDDNRGLRGSQNQRVHYLTKRLVGFDFETGPRSVELAVHDGYAFMVGIPPKGVVDRLREVI